MANTRPRIKSSSATALPTPQPRPIYLRVRTVVVSFDSPKPTFRTAVFQIQRSEEWIGG